MIRSLSRHAVTEDNPVAVRIGLVGRQHAGKTVLLNALPGSLEPLLPSGMRLGISCPQRLAQALQQRRLSELRLRSQGEQTTIDATTATFSLLAGGRERIKASVTDALGQVLTRTTPSAPTDLKKKYEDYLTDLADADVLWTVIPSPPARAGAADEQRLRDDALLTVAYVQAALRRRQSKHPLALALVISRCDVRYGSEADARARMPREFLAWMTRQVSQLAASAETGDVRVFPISALGFGSTTVRGGPIDQLALGEPEWVLRPGVAPRPWNVTPLLAWSLQAAVENRPQDDFGAAALQRTVALCRSLRDDLKALGGWHLPVSAA